MCARTGPAEITRGDCLGPCSKIQRLRFISIEFLISFWKLFRRPRRKIILALYREKTSSRLCGCMSVLKSLSIDVSVIHMYIYLLRLQRMCRSIVNRTQNSLAFYAIALLYNSYLFIRFILFKRDIF